MVRNLPPHSIKLITLTLKNEDDLAGMLAKLKESWNRLRHRKLYKQVFEGGLYVYETTNTGNGWHVHIHATIVMNYLDVEQLRADWLEITGDSFEVDIREIPGLTGLGYCLKYLKSAPKLSSVEQEKEYDRVMKHTRLCQPFGSWIKTKNKAQGKPESPLICQTCGNNTWHISVAYANQSEATVENFLPELTAEQREQRSRGQPRLRGYSFV